MKLKMLEKGRSMIEMLGVLAIMGLITAMGIGGYNMAMGGMKKSEVQEDVVKILQEVRSLFAGSTFDGLSTSTLVNIGLLQSDGAGGAKNPYGGKYIVKSIQNNVAFTIDITQVPAKDCEYFKTKNWDGEVDGKAKANGGSGACNAKNTLTLEYR